MKKLDNISTDKSKILPVILCGGEGTRLWPLSRKSFPKQFLSLDNDDQKSLLQKTQTRILKYARYSACKGFESAA